MDTLKISSIMFQGTASHVGKSILSAALCRILVDDGHSVAPFKAQNMALNSYVTQDGLEIGMAQAFQAEAACIEPTVYMNPILLKPLSDRNSQVIIHGRPYRNMSALEYHEFKKKAKMYVYESYSRLCDLYDIIVIEGAGSPAEINLREHDIVNMGLAEMIDAPVVLIGDIERGGVFASFIGTLELLSGKERKRVKGFIINKFRGDIGLLRPGIDYLEKKTKIPVVGVIPYINRLYLPQEDSVFLEEMEQGQGSCDRIKKEGEVVISVIRLPHISNFTDFDPFKFESDSRLRYIESIPELEGTDILIIPGTKNTIDDLLWLRKGGFAEAIVKYAGNGGMVIGICGGFQMLGHKVKDLIGIESDIKEIDGLSLLDVETTLKNDKSLYQVEGMADIGDGSYSISGYEIHMGDTSSSRHPFSLIKRRNWTAGHIKDGAISEDSNIWGTYIHGVFNNDGFRKALLDRVRFLKGHGSKGTVSFSMNKEKGIRELSRVVRANINLKKLYEIAGIPYKYNQ